MTQKINDRSIQMTPLPEFELWKDEFKSIAQAFGWTPGAVDKLDWERMREEHFDTGETPTYAFNMENGTI